MRFFLCLLWLIPSLCFASSFIAERVISLSPHTTELAYSAGLGSKLIAVSDYSNYPLAAEKLPKVANYRGLNLEEIVALKPDLILAWKGGNPTKDMAKLASLGLRIYYSNPESLQAIANTVRQLGQYTKDPSFADHNADKFLATLAELKKKYDHMPSTPFFYQLSTTPLMTMNDHGWPAPIFQFCGGENIFANSPVPYPQVSMEQVIVKQPSVMFSTSADKNVFNLWKNWVRTIPALRSKHTYFLNADWLNRPTFRSAYAIQQVCKDFELAHSSPPLTQ